MRIIITSNSNPELVKMVRRAYHRASGNPGFANPDVIYRDFLGDSHLVGEAAA